MAGNLVSVPTNIGTGTGTGGYLETSRLRGWSTLRMTADFRAQLRQKERLAVVYDHPFFAGIHALEQVAALVQTAREEGFTLTTMSAAATALGAESMARSCA